MFIPFNCRMLRVPLAVAIAAALPLTPALAQSQSQGNQQQDQTSNTQSTNQQNQDQNQNKNKNKNQSQKATQLGEVTVSGSLIKMPENESVSPVQTVDIQTRMRTGSLDTADVVMGTAIASGSTEINGQFGGFVVNGGTGVQSVDLRGLGAGRTLVLLDGQRPGKSGTRGSIAAFDLNVLPVSIIQRIDIVKDGSSSIYGSDAIAGVVNVITKKQFPRPVLNVAVQPTQHGGGNKYLASFADGWQVDAGNIIVAAQIDRRDALKRKDRSFLSCTRDRVWGADGQRVDLPDHSLNQGTKFAGCNYLRYNDYINAINGNDLVPASPGNKGAQPGIIPGYVIRRPVGYDASAGQVPYLQRTADAEFLRNAYVLGQKDRGSLYLAANLGWGSIGWDTELLYSYRKSKQKDFRQFFPAVVYPYGATYPTTAQAVFEPVTPYPANTSAKVDYFYGATKLTGIFPWTDTWAWEVNGTYTKSRGTYVVDAPGIDARISGDLTTAQNEVDNPPINLLDPRFLTGEAMQEEVNAFALNNTGHTTFSQETVNAVINGTLFQGWAGDAEAAFGAEFRHTGLNDVPSESTLNQWQWGLTAAGHTHGTDNVKEVFAQIGLPLVKGVPGIEKLTLDLSGREFRYNSVGKKDNVWKAGLNWQITSTLRARATLGTSYRAPQLFQLYLADQTGFLQQLNIDPCIQWGESTNEQIREHCQAAGIPPDYQALGYPTGTAHSGGGKGFLEPETARNKTIGVVWTPSFGNMRLSLDYFDIRIKDEITQISASTVAFSCYGRPVYPNAFCDQLDRKPPDAALQPNMITDVFATYTNINKERLRGYDLFGKWAEDFSFGHMFADLDIVYTLSDVTQVFSSAEASGVPSSERIGYIGNPKLVGNLHWGLSWGDWAVTWQTRYVGSTRNKDIDREYTYAGREHTFRDLKMGWQFRHDASVSYNRDTWGITAGVRNLFDQKPDFISGVAGYNMVGQVPLAASQYDWFGRTFFANFQYKF
jgi:iron complex outermembrane receptor protein